MWRPCSALLLLALLAGVGVAQSEVAGTPGAAIEQERIALTTLLGAGGTTFEKAKACQRLAVIGDASSVPAIALLLFDPKLADYARTALEQIPGEAAGEALITAIGQLRQPAAEAIDVQQRERLLIGLLHSVGRRLGDSARPLLTQIADAADVSAAVRATATRALAALDPPAQTEEASPPADLAKLLQSPEPRSFRRGLQQARQQGNAAALLAEQLPQLPPPRQGALLVVLAELGDDAVVAAIEPLAESEDDDVAATAWETLGSLGELQDSADRAAAGFAAALARPTIAPRVLAALGSAENPQLDAQVKSAIQKLADGQQTPEPTVAIGLFQYAVTRQLNDVAEPLMQIARSQSDPVVAAAAIRAAGSLVSLYELAALLLASEQLAQLAPEGLLTLAAGEALQRATVRMPPDEVAEVIAGLLADAQGPRKAVLLEQLALVGGERALDVVAEVARSSDLADVDMATRVLGQWLSADAADVLGDLAANLNHPAYRLRSLRGYLRLGRQFDLPPEQRTNLAAHAYQLADRDEERTLAIDILLRFPTLEGLKWLAETGSQNRDLNEPQRQEIYRVLLQVAGYIAREQPQPYAALLQAVDLQPLPEVLQTELLRLTEPAESR